MSYPVSRHLSRIYFLLLTILPILAWSNSFSQPAVSNVTFPASGLYTLGNHIDFVVNLNQPVNVTLGAESPYIPITLDTGTNARAIYFSGTGTNTLVFRYTVENTHKDNNGIVLGTSIVLSSSTILNGANESLILTLNGVGSTIGLKVDGIPPKLIYNQPVGNFPTTKRDIQFLLKFNKLVNGLSLNSFELAASPSLTASLSSFKKINDTIYSVWVSDQTTSSNYTGTIKLNIKPAFASTIKDNLNQSLDASTVAIGTSATIEFPLAITVTSYTPTPNPFSGGIVKIVGLNLARVDKVLIGNVEAKILSNNDLNLDLLVMPGSDTLDGTLKIVRGTDTIYPILGSASYKARKTNFPISPLNKLNFTNSSNQKIYSNFAIDKSGKFAIVCDEFDNGGAGSCAFFLNDYGTTLNQRIGWRQVGQRFRYPDNSINYPGFGSAIAIDANGKHIAIGAKNAFMGKGEVIIYNVNANSYNSNGPIDSILTVNHIVSGSTIFDNFGASIEMSADGNTLMVGAPGFDTNNGAVFVYKKLFDQWTQLPLINKPTDAIGSSVNFGSTIALSADGDKAFITAINDNESKGAVWGFQNSTTSWTQLGTKIVASNYSNTGYFGASIALSANANKIIIGAPTEQNSKGAFYHFNRSNNLISQVGGPITDTTSDNSSEFGTSLSMSANGDLFAVSAPLNSRGAYFIYGIQKDSIELLYSNINKSTDSFFNKRIQLDYLGNNLLTEVTYTNSDKIVTGLEALSKPIFRSLNRNFITSNTSDTIIAKLDNARSVSKVLFGDTINLKYQALTDSTIAILIDSNINNTKKRINLKYGFENNYTDSVVIDRTKPTVKVIFNKIKTFNDTVFQAKLRFSEKIATNIVTYFPLLPNGFNGQPTVRLDSVKADTAGLVYTAYYKVLIPGPIFFSNSNLGAFEDSAGNKSLPILSTDTIIFDNITIAPNLYVGRLTSNLYNINIRVFERIKPGSLELNFLDFRTDTIFHTWVLSNTITNTILYDVNLLANPLSYPFVTSTSGAPQLRNGKYKLRLSYQDSLSNPKAYSPSWNVSYRDSVPTIYTYASDTNKQLDSILIKGIYFSNIDSIKIGNSIVQYRVLNDSLLLIDNSRGVTANYIYFYYDADSTTLDVNYIKGGNNANTKVTIKKAWQKFYNLKKGRLRNISMVLQNSSSSIDHKMVLEIYKDTNITSSLNPSVKFNNFPIAKSDTSILFKSSPDTVIESNQQFLFSKDTLLLEDSTNYFFVIKQLDNAESSLFKILVEENNSRSGANNEVNLNLKYDVITSPFLLMDPYPPFVSIKLNKQGAFKDSVFQVKLRFTEKIATTINNSYFPVMPNAIGGAPMARLDSVRVDTLGLVYTGYFKALQNGPIFFSNPSFHAFNDFSGNISLPIPNSDTIIYDTVTRKPLLYVNRNSVDSILVSFLIPEKKFFSSLKLTFSNFKNDSLITTWVISNTYTQSGEFVVNLNDNPLSNPFIHAVLPVTSILQKGKYIVRLTYQDTLENPPGISDSWTVNLRDSLPTVYTYSPDYNNAMNLLTIKGKYFSRIDSLKIGNKIPASYTIFNDSIINIVNKVGTRTGDLQFFYRKDRFESDSTVNDFNYINGGINAADTLVINKAWQKFRNVNKGRLNKIKLRLLNNSTTIDNRIILEIHKDTVVTASLDPAIKFTSPPILKSDTLSLLKNTSLAFKSFTFSDSTVILDDSTDYFIVVKQINNATENTFKILADINTPNTGAVNVNNAELQYQIATRPFVVIDTIPPSVKVILNKNVPFNDTVFQAKLRFSEKIATNIVTYFPLLPNGFNGQPTARLDSVKADTAGLVYTAYFKALISGPIFFSNSNLGAFEDSAGNRSLPILSTDTIIFDNTTIAPNLYVGRLTSNLYNIDIRVPERIKPGSLELNFLDFRTDTIFHTWVLSNTSTNTILYDVNLLANPLSYPFVTSVSKEPYLRDGKYKLRLSYQDYLSNPKAYSPSWNVSYRDSVPTIYTYASDTNKQLDSILIKGIYFSNIDSIKIGNSIVQYRVLNDSLLLIDNSRGVAANYIYFYYDADSTTLDVNYIKGGNNANTKITIKKAWQKFYNLKKGRLRNISMVLENSSRTIDHKMVLEIYKDTNITSSLNPSVKFNNFPIAKSDTSILFKAPPDTVIQSNQQFLFSKDTLLLEDSTNYFFVIKQLDNAESSLFKILVEENNSRSGANNEVNLNLKYDVITSPFLLMDPYPPFVSIKLNKQGAFRDSVFEVKLRFTEKIATTINNSYFPVMPNAIGGAPMARLDSVKVDLAGLLYTGYFKALQNGPIFFSNPSFNAFNDFSGNISLPISNSDTIIYDNITIPASLNTNQIVVDSLTLDYNIPEKIGPGSAKLVFTNIATNAVDVIWSLKDSVQRLSNRNVNPFSDPTTFTFVRSVFPSNARLTYGNYRITLTYQDSLLNPVATSGYSDIRIINRTPIVYDYTPEVNSKFNELKLKGINFSFVDSVKINNKKVTFTRSSDSTLTILDKSTSNAGFIQFYFLGDSTNLDFTKIYGAINASNQYTINKTWQKFYNNYKGALNNIKLKLSNSSSTIDNKMVLEIYKDTITTASLDPSLKFNNQPLIISDTLNLLRNSSLSEKVFNFSKAVIILKDSTNYYFVLKQINNIGIESSKVLGEPTSLKNGAINEAFRNLYFEIATKPYIFMDTIRPSSSLVIQNPFKVVSGPFFVDIVFNEPVQQFRLNQLPLLASVRNDQPTATADSIVTILPQIWYRQYFTPKQLGKIIVFNLFEGVTQDLAGNNALPIGADSVTYIGNDFKLTDIDLPYSRSGNIVQLFGKGFNYLDLIKFNDQKMPSNVLNDSIIEITIPNAASSGKLVLYNKAGDSTNNKLTMLSSSGTSFARTDTSFIKFIPTHTGALDSLQFYFNNSNSNNTNYFVEIFDHNGNKVYKRKIATSDTVQLIGNASQKKINFSFRNHNYVVIKDSTYFIRLNQIGTLPNPPTILTGSTGQVKYNYAVNAHILIKDAGLNAIVSNNAINGMVDGSYYIDVLFDRPIRYANKPLMLPGVDSTGQFLARVDSTVISDDGLRYRQFISPLKKGKIIFFNSDFGFAIDYYGNLSAPFGFDTVNYATSRKPIILSYDKKVVAPGRVIQVVGKYLSNTKTIKINNINASFFVKNEDTLIFIAPLNAGSGSIKLLNERNESITNFVDTFFNNATLFGSTTFAWQKMTLAKSGLFSKIGIVFNNTSTTGAKFNLSIYKKINHTAQNILEKFDSAILKSDTVTVGSGTNGIVHFTFNDSTYIASKDSNYYFVINNLNNISNVQLQFESTNTNTGSVGGVNANIKHTLEVQPYLMMDTISPVPTLTANTSKTAGPFWIDLSFSEPIFNLARNPIIVNPGLDSLPKARLDSVAVIQPGIKYRYYYTPKSEGTLSFSIPFFGIANDNAGNVSTLATTLLIKYIDTNNNNLIRANGNLNICNGDSLRIFSTVDSAFKIKWNTGDTTRSILVKKPGQYFFKIFVNDAIDFNSDSLQVMVNEIPAVPSIRRNKDSLISSAQLNNIWYKNKTKLEATSRIIIPTSSDTFYVQSNSNNCSSGLSSPYVFKFLNFNSLPKITKLGATKFCQGDSVLLKFNNDSAYKLKWNTGSTANQITIKESGQYFVQIFIDSMYSYNSDTVFVEVNAYPTKPIISRIGDSLVSNSLYGNKWYKNNVKMTDTTRNIKPVVSDYYTVQVDVNNCPSPISTVYYYLVTSIIDLKNNTVAIFPNPFTEYVTIIHNKTNGQQVQLEIIQMNDGVRVHTQQLLELSSRIYLNKLISGIYLFNIIDAKGKVIAQYKMVKL